jgi:hypothetical protein
VRHFSERTHPSEIHRQLQFLLEALATFGQSPSMESHSHLNFGQGVLGRRLYQGEKVWRRMILVLVASLQVKTHVRIRTVNIGRRTSDGPQEVWLRVLEYRNRKTFPPSTSNPQRKKCQAHVIWRSETRDALGKYPSSCSPKSFW